MRAPVIVWYCSALIVACCIEEIQTQDSSSHPMDLENAASAPESSSTRPENLIESTFVFQIPEIQTLAPETEKASMPRYESPFDRIKREYSYFDFETQMVALHTELCGSSCYFLHPGATSTILAKACSPCFCDQLCHIYNDCCPDVQLLGPVDHQEEDTTMPYTAKEAHKMKAGRDLYTCEKAHLKVYNAEDDFDNFFSMLNYCPLVSTASSTFPSFSANSSTAQRVVDRTLPLSSLSWDFVESSCENREGSSAWPLMRPVTSLQTGVVYRNRYCALCHGESSKNLIDWVTTVSCDDNDVLLSAKSTSQAYSLAQNASECDVRFFAPDGKFRRCKHVIPPVINQCNVTGDWYLYDERVERACASFTSIVNRIYKNVFCFMCNTFGDFTMTEHQLTISDSSANVGRASFYALLDFGKDEQYGEGSDVGNNVVGTLSDNSSSIQCGEGKVLNPQTCQCQPVECGPGLRDRGDNCTEVFAASTNLGFSVCVLYTITSSTALDVIHAQNFMLYLNIFYVHDFGNEAKLLKATAYPSFDCHDERVLRLYIDLKIYSWTPSTLQDLARNIYSSLKNSVDGWNSANDIEKVTLQAPADYCFDFDGDFWFDTYPRTCVAIALKSQEAGMLVFSGKIQSRMNLHEIMFTKLLNTSFCPRLSLSSGEFLDLLSHLNGTDVTYDVIHTEGGNSSYLVCARDLMQAYEETCTCPENHACPRDKKITKVELATPRFQDTWTALGVTSVVLTCVSLLCLLCVIVTYSAFSTLRSGTGSCTLAMTCLLFVAEALHEFGLEQFEVWELCLTLSLLIHLFWLSAVFMMTCCTLQLFFAISFPIKTRAYLASRATLWLSLLLSLGLAALIVGATMLGNYLSSRELGYPAKHECFISNSLSRLLGFALPLGLAVVFNVILFVVAVVKIRGRPTLSSSSRYDKVSMAACVRLSVITGASWLCLFLLVIPGTKPWLEYLAIALLASQGILLATTLLLTPRVKALWLGICRLGKKSKELSNNEEATRKSSGSPETSTTTTGCARSTTTAG